MYGNFSELDQARDQIVISEGATDSVLAHEIGHGAFSAAKDFFLQKVAELGSKEAAFVAVSLEYGRDVAENIRSVVDQAAAIGFADENEGTVQYYDNPLSDDPENPGVGTATFEGGETYYTPGGGFEGPYDRPRPVSTDLLLQKPFTDYRTGELVYHDEYKGGEGDFEADMKKAGLGGFETLMSDLIAKERELDPMSERKRRRLKINPLGAPEGEVLRSVRPKFRPENFAQGGPVMNGIGTLNETARNMFRGPSGVGTYQQFASGGEAMGPLNMPYGSGQGYMPYGLSNQQAYQPSQLGMGGMQQGNGINQYSQYLEKTYGNPEFDQKRDNFLNNVQQQEQQTFGGMDGGMNPFDIYQQPMRQSGPTPQGIGAFPFDLYQQQSRPTPQGSGRQDGIGDFPKFSDDNVRGFGPEQAFLYAQGGLPPNEMQLFASGGEAMGPPPTRGPDPQGIGAFQKFADGGPVYMQEGGTGKDALATNHFDLIKEKYPSVDPLKISQEEGLPPQLISVFQRLLFQENQSADASAVGTSGEIGLAQLMPVTAKDVGVDRDNLIDNVRGGARYLFKMYNRFDQDPMKAVAAYNAGPTAIVDNLDRNDGQLNIGQLPSTTQSYLGFVVQPVLNQTEVAQTIDPMMAGEDLAMSMPVAQSDYLSPEAQENIRQGTQFQGGSPTGDLSIGEQIRREKFKPNVSFEGQEMEAMPVNLRDKYSSKNMQEQLVGGQEPLDKGIAGLTRSLRPPLRPEEGLTRSLRPPFRPEEEEMREPQDRYPGTNTDIGEGFGIYI